MSLEYDEKESIRKVNLSYKRCLLHEDFFTTFYEYFLKTDRRIAEHFQYTDFAQQRIAIKHGIEYMIMFAEGSRIASSKIESLSINHDRNHLNVQPELYKNWLNSLLKTIEVYDKEFNEDLKNSWIQILSYGISRMKAKY